MITLVINRVPVSIEEGATVLEAARKAGGFVPTLCFLANNEAHASCMICAVRETRTGRILPACAARAETGMVIETESPEVLEIRQGVLGLLFSEHSGECEAPCRQACPAGIDTPRMLRLAAAEKWSEAFTMLRIQCALPGVLSRICHAPCQKACRLGQIDRPVRICALQEYIAGKGQANLSASPPDPDRLTGNRVAIVGAGPAGLSAADALARQGHACTVFDDHAEPGGMLRYGIAGEILPRMVLQAEIDRIRDGGVLFRMGVTIGADIMLAALQQEYDAVIVASGEIHAANPLAAGLEKTSFGLRVDKTSWAASRPGVFAAGGSVRPSRHAVRSLAQGRWAAAAVDRFLLGIGERHHYTPFRSRLGRLSPEEIRRMFNHSPDFREEPENWDPGAGFLTARQAAREASRCLQCGCRKADHCRLREYAGMYHASPKKYRTSEPRPVKRIWEHADVLHEPGKCIKCGRCVRVTANGAEPLGLTFVGRGYNLRIGVPFDGTLDQGMNGSAARCVEACPTGALVFRMNSIACGDSSAEILPLPPDDAPGEDRPADVMFPAREEAHVACSVA